MSSKVRLSTRTKRATLQQRRNALLSCRHASLREEVTWRHRKQRRAATPAEICLPALPASRSLHATFFRHARGACPPSSLFALACLLPSPQR